MADTTTYSYSYTSYETARKLFTCGSGYTDAKWTMEIRKK
jgi:hypothetical protein